MASIRLYSGDDGESHIEEIDPSSHPDWTPLHNAKGIVFRALLPGFSVIGTWPLGGSILSLSPVRRKSGFGDGTVHRLGPEDVNFAEDLTGGRHTTRVGSVLRVVATIHLED